MGKIRGFMDYDRVDEAYLSVTKRLKNYDEFTIEPKDTELEEQAEDVWTVVFLFVILVVL